MFPVNPLPGTTTPTCEPPATLAVDVNVLKGIRPPENEAILPNWVG